MRIGFLFLCCCLAVQAQSGIVTGTVKDGQGNYVAGVAVTAVPQPLTRTATPGSTPPMSAYFPTVARAITGSDVNFEIDGLLAGKYVLCVQPREVEVLDPCIWSLPRPTVAVTSGATVSGGTVILTRGVTILIRIADKQAQLAPDPSADDIRIGTHHGQFTFVGARVIARDLFGRTLGLVVPASSVLDILVRSTAFSLADSNGSALTPGEAVIPFTAPSVSPTAAGDDLTKAAPALTIQVRGKAAGPA